MQSVIQDRGRFSFAEALRSVKLKDTTKRLGLTHAKKFRRQSLWQKPQRFGKMLPRVRHSHRINPKIRVRAIPYKLPLPLERSIVKDGFVEYKRDMSPVKLKRITQLRQDLHEKNPYVTPSDGVTSKFRVALRIVEKVFKKYEENLPIHLRQTWTSRYKNNVNKVLRKVLGPEENILPTKILVQEEQWSEESITTLAKPLEHVQNWKEIEALHIVRRFKLNEIEIIGYEMRVEENALTARKKVLQDQVTRLEELVLSTDGDITMGTLHDHDRRLSLGRKVEKVNALNMEVGNLSRMITNTLDDLDRLRTIQQFFFQISPIPWRKVHDYLNPVRRGSEKLLVSVYCLQSVGDGLTGYLDQDMEHLEAMDKCERRRPKHLYFEHPQQVAKAFRDAEDTNLGMIQDCLDIQIRAEELKSQFEKKFQEYDAKIAEVERMVCKITEKADFEESKAKELQSITRINNAMKYKELEQAQMLQNIKARVKQIRVEVCGRETSLPILIQLGDIEREYRCLSDEIAFMPAKYVADLEAKVISDERKYREQEADAARRLEEFQKVSQRLKRALAPPPSPEERRERLVKARSAANLGTRRKRRAVAGPNNSGNSSGLEGHGARLTLTPSTECEWGLA